MAQFRAPVLRFPFGTTAGGRAFTGDVFFVGSASAGASDDAATNGNESGAPFATLSFAIGQATANNGDVIYCLPGHVETISSAGALALNKAGVTIIGLGNGTNRAQLIFDSTTAADMDVTAANVVLEGFLIDCTAIDALLAPIDIDAADFTMRQCEILTADSAGQAVDVMTVGSGSHRLIIEDCFFNGTTNPGTARLLAFLGACSDVRIRRNLITGEWTASMINDDAGHMLTGIIIEDNKIIDYFGSWIIETTDTGWTGLVKSNTVVTPEPSTVFANASSPALAFVDNFAFDSDINDDSGPIPIPVLGGILLGGTSLVDTIIGNEMFYNRYRSTVVTVDLTSATWNTVGLHEVFVVTGMVRARIIVYCTSDLTDAGGGTIQFGKETDTDALIALTTSADIDTGEIWNSATPTTHITKAAVIDIIVNGEDLGYEIATAAATGGTLIFLCWHEPLTASASVAAGAGGTL